MDMQTLGVAIALAKGMANSVLPEVGAADAGEVLTVGSDGKWTTGTIVGATIAVDGTTLTITPGGE